MTAVRPIAAFLVCLVASNLVFLLALFAPILITELSHPVAWTELAASLMFVSVFSLPTIFMGGLSFGLAAWGLARHLRLSRSVPMMMVIGAGAAMSYTVFALLLIGGLDRGILSLLIPAGLAGGVAGALWTLLFERRANA